LFFKVVYSRTLSERLAIELMSEQEKHEHKLIRCTSIQEDQLKLEAIHPFKFDFHLLSMQASGHPFLCHPYAI
jgi:hypothetical protein